MVIKYEPRSKTYNLIINNVFYGSHDSAVAAADNVYCHVTSCHDWDILDSSILDVPTDIYQWKKA
jgi:hypothetical protein